MELQKILDTNLLVYALVESHPASQVCEEFILDGIEKFDWVTASTTFFEAYFVLTKLYRVEDQHVLNKLEILLKSAIIIRELPSSRILDALKKAQKYKLDSNDSILLELAKTDRITILATDDQRLARAAKTEGLVIENPIGPEIRTIIVKWEQNHLPSKGATRLLSRVHAWLNSQDVHLADLFLESTKYLKKPP